MILTADGVVLPPGLDPAIIRRMLKALLRAMRPKQWIKNILIYSALVFDQQLLTPAPFLRTTAGFILFCLGASAVYLVNDLADMEQDRHHPTKKNRPLASGELPPAAAKITAVLFFALSISLGFLLSPGFGLILVTYLVLNLLYSFWLKHIPIIDIFILASGYVLRVAAGVSIITVQRFSPWMYVCITVLALFLGLGKRRSEMILMADKANSHRRVLDGYTIPYIDQLLSIVSSTTIVAYSLYTFSAVNLPDNHLMMLTIPLVVYGIFRYLYLIHVEDEGGAPEELVLRDKPLLASVVLWGLAAIIVLYAT
jgi:4-hydroxybenzoate polyprenyltransferase